MYIYIYIYVHSLAGCGSQMGMDRSAVMRTSELGKSGLGQVQLVIFGYGSYPLGMYAWVLIGAMAFGSRVWIGALHVEPRPQHPLLRPWGLWYWYVLVKQLFDIFDIQKQLKPLGRDSFRPCDPAVSPRALCGSPSLLNHGSSNADGPGSGSCHHCHSQNRASFCNCVPRLDSCA